MTIIDKTERFIDRCHPINDLIESVALIETELSSIINAEGDKIKKAININEYVDAPIDDLITVNNSVDEMINSITNLEMMLQFKLEIISDLDNS